MVDTINIGLTTGALTITPDGNFVYVTSGFDDLVSVIRTTDNTVIQTIANSDQPFAVSITPEGSFAYVVNNFSDNVSVIRTSDNQIVDTIAVGDRPFSFGPFITAGPTGVASNVPTLSKWGLIALVASIGIIGFIALKRKSEVQS